MTVPASMVIGLCEVYELVVKDWVLASAQLPVLAFSPCSQRIVRRTVIGGLSNMDDTQYNGRI